MPDSLHSQHSDDETEAKSVRNQALFTVALVLSSLALFWLHDRQSHIVKPPSSESESSDAIDDQSNDKSTMATEDILLLNRD